VAGLLANFKNALIWSALGFSLSTRECSSTAFQLPQRQAVRGPGMSVKSITVLIPSAARFLKSSGFGRRRDKNSGHLTEVTYFDIRETAYGSLAKESAESAKTSNSVAIIVGEDFLTDFILKSSVSRTWFNNCRAAKVNKRPFDRNNAVRDYLIFPNSGNQKAIPHLGITNNKFASNNRR